MRVKPRCRAAAIVLRIVRKPNVFAEEINGSVPTIRFGAEWSGICAHRRFIFESSSARPASARRVGDATYVHMQQKVHFKKGKWKRFPTEGQASAE